MDNKSTKTTRSRHHEKVCGICQKKETTNWARHWKDKHPNIKPFQAPSDALSPPNQQEEQNDQPSCRHRSHSEHRAQNMHRDLQQQSQHRAPQGIQSFVIEDQTIYMSEFFLEDETFRMPKHQNLMNQQKMNPNKIYKEVSSQILDQRLIEKLEALKTSNISDQQGQALILENCEFFTQHLVAQYLSNTKNPRLSDLLTQLNYQFQLNQYKTTGILFAMIVLDDFSYNNIQKFYRQVPISIKSEVNETLNIFLKSKFKNEEVCLWITENLNYLNESFVPIINLLEKAQIQSSYGIMNAARVCSLPEDLQDFLVTSQMLFKSEFKLVISESIKNFPHQPKLDFFDFVDIVQTLITYSNRHAIKTNYDQLISKPMNEWPFHLESILKDQEINQQYEQEVSAYLYELSKLVTIDYATNRRLANSDTIDQIQKMLKQIDMRPNNFQLAVGKFAICILPKNKKQLYSLHAGTGKSRIQATIALYALLANTAEKVHFVFPNDHLMNRDQRLYKAYFELSSFSVRVFYHMSLDFESTSKDLIIMDEADYFIFQEPSEFSQMIHKTPTICLTGTAYDATINEIEKQLLQKLGLTQVCYNPSAMQKNLVPIVDREIDFSESQTLIEFVSAQLSEGPVLVHGTDAHFTLLHEAQLNPLKIISGVDDQILSNLDTIQDAGRFKLLVTTDELGVRGIDYRAKRTGITLIVLQSYSCERQAIQGLNRVGRFEDKCTRLKDTNIKLVDQQLSHQATARIFSFLNEKKRKRKDQEVGGNRSNKRQKVGDSAQQIDIPQKSENPPKVYDMEPINDGQDQKQDENLPSAFEKESENEKKLSPEAK